jgi:SAM-dependent methyltransferase
MVSEPTLLQSSRFGCIQEFLTMHSRIGHRARSLIYPGLDLHVRNRASLVQFWKTGPRDVLDAGSGNGYFAWLAYQSGARVVAMNVESAQVDKARRFLVGYKRADPARLQFEHRNLYDLCGEQRFFDETICFETLEHLRRDHDVVQQFYRILRPGGALHLCCPYRLHPRHQVEVPDKYERGGHVRQGYTEEDYRRLLEPLGFEIDRVIGIGPRSVYWADAILRAIRGRFGDLPALPLLPLMLPFVWAARENPAVPFSIYARAMKT